MTRHVKHTNDVMKAHVGYQIQTRDSRYEPGLYNVSGMLQGRSVPETVSARDRVVIEKMRQKVHKMEHSSEFCGVKMGRSAKIGLIPIFGAVYNYQVGRRTLNIAKDLDEPIPSRDLRQMKATLAKAFALGLIPLAGDLFQLLYKANTNVLMRVESLVGAGALERSN